MFFSSIEIKGKHLDRDLSRNQELMYEYQYNTMLSCARKDNLDAILVMADCIGGFTTKERVREMLWEYQDIPCVLIASKTEGYVDVSCDNYNGLKEGLEYLLNNLNCKKFCMITGPDKHVYDDLIEQVDIFMDSEILQYADIDSLIKHLLKVHQDVVADRPNQTAYIKTHGIALDIYRRMAKALDFRILSMQENTQSTNYNFKLFLRDMMQFRNGEDQSYSVLLKRPSWLGIENAYLYVFISPINHLARETFQLPEYIYLKAVLKNGTVREAKSIRQRKHMRDIFCNDEIGPQRYSMTLLPLYTGETILGVLLCDMSDNLFENDEFLSNQLGSAVNMIHL